MAIDRDGHRDSSLRLCVDSAHVYGVDRREALEMIEGQVEAIREAWDDVADANRLTTAERTYLFGRQILNPSTFYGLPTT